MKKKRSKVPPGLSRKMNSEKAVAKNLLNNFVAKGSKGQTLIEDMLGFPITQISLKALINFAILVSGLCDIKFERNYKRKKDLIVKWFNDNEEFIVPFKNYFKVIADDNDDDQNEEEKGQNNLVFNFSNEIMLNIDEK